MIENSSQNRRTENELASVEGSTSVSSLSCKVTLYQGCINRASNASTPTSYHNSTAPETLQAKTH